jgi:hypothetical protein
MRKLSAIFLSLLVVAFISGCSEESESPNYGKLTFNFQHHVDGEPVIFNSMQYTNAAGSEYEVTEVQWFISDITLKKNDGTVIILDQNEFAHYIDTNPNRLGTLTWNIQDDVPVGDYQSIKMTFGLKGEKNIHYTFPDQPESSMEWPIILGGQNGGYHYMKLNGFWNNTQGLRRPFNFHLGVGQERDTEGNISGYIQNWFEVELANSGFTLNSDQRAIVKLVMNIQNWFNNPNIYDHNEYGGAIMDKQEAMGKACANGKEDVFEAQSIVVE